jgi:hypothetical protein
MREKSASRIVFFAEDVNENAMGPALSNSHHTRRRFSFPFRTIFPNSKSGGWKVQRSFFASTSFHGPAGASLSSRTKS